jgi:pyridoxine 5-phosphate synthase
MPATHQRLYINIDHVATLRQARGGGEPDPVAAALICERAGADGITAHLREDRRHIQDDDVHALVSQITTFFNLEVACVPEMIAIAVKLKPGQVTLVPERRQEITTEGGLDVLSDPARIRHAVDSLNQAGIRTSLFIDPDTATVDASAKSGANAIELHTGAYSNSPDAKSIRSLAAAAGQAKKLGLAVHAGHGLTVQNVGPVAAISEIEELNIGHSIVSRAIFVGMETAVREMRDAMTRARGR